MRKIYSLVLMAMMLLVGTNAWAQNAVTVTGAGAGNYGSLQLAVNAIPAGGTATITLNEDIHLSAPVVIPQVTGEVTDAQKVVNREMQHITLNLNNFDIDAASGYKGAAIILLKGELNIEGEGKISRSTATSDDGAWAGSWGNFSKSTIVVCGADGDKTVPANDRSKQEWSVLTIGEKVTIEGKGNKNDGTEGGFGVCIQNFNESNFKNKINAIEFANLGYQTIYTTAENNANGKLWWDNQSNAGCAFGVKVIVKGKIEAYQRGINILGTVNQSAKMVEDADKRTSAEYPFYAHNYPYVKIEQGAIVSCKEDGLESGNGGIYGGGWAVIDIYGTVKGQTGVFLKGGDVVVDGGHVQSTSTASQAGTSANYGGNVSGNAIFIASAANYSGATNVAVEGGATIEAGTAGAAIVDKVATDANATNPTVQHVDIIEGTIDGGNLGGIVATTGTAGKTTIINATVEGGITINGQPATTQEVANIMTTGSNNVPGSNNYSSSEPDVIITQPTNTNNIVVGPNTAKLVTLNAYGLSTYSFESTTTDACRVLPTGVTAWVTTGALDANNNIVLTQVNGNIPAGVGVILYGENKANKQQTLALETSGAATIADNTNKLLAASNWTNGQTQEYAYVLVGNELYLYTGTQMKPNKAYLKLNTAATSYGAPQRIRMVFNQTEQTEAVENVEAESVKAVKFMGADGQLYIRRGDVVYTVQGQVVK